VARIQWNSEIFVNEDGTAAKNYQYLNDVPQLVLCIPADAVEEDHGEVDNRNV
jgi:hypothetical protein